MAALVAARHPGVTWWCPQLPPSPRDALAIITQGTRDWPRDTMAMVGSSLGGFYATCLAERSGCRAVLLNPAVQPARDLAQHIGEQGSWHDPQERFFFQSGFVDELRAMAPGALTQRGRYFAVIARGDEVLDWREMSQRYAGAHIRLIEGSDHALSDFDDHVEEVLVFLNLA